MTRLTLNTRDEKRRLRFNPHNRHSLKGATMRALALRRRRRAERRRLREGRSS